MQPFLLYLHQVNIVKMLINYLITMKRFNRKFIKGTNWALAGLLSLLGFSSCGDDKDDKGWSVEYGTPYANYIVTGRVMGGGQPLAGVRVAVVSADHCQATRPGFIPDHPVMTTPLTDTLFTDGDGRFEYPYDGFPTDTVKIKMKFDDVASNTFASDSAVVTFNRNELKYGSGWFEGSINKVVQFILQKEFDDDCCVVEYGTPYAKFKESEKVTQREQKAINTKLKEKDGE